MSKNQQKMPTATCPMCGGKTDNNPDLLGKHPNKFAYHAHCPKCKASFSNSMTPKNRAVIWDDVAGNVYPQEAKEIARLRSIIDQSMNKQNRKKKEPGMCSENSEDALTWTMFNVLEEYSLIDHIYSWFSGSETPSGQGNTRIFYWGYNDKHPNDKMIKTYIEALESADEPNWGGGFSEPDILLFNPSHGLINVEVKYKSPNDDKLKDRSNQKRLERAQKMLDVGQNYVKKSLAQDWQWYELLRMWVPGCKVADDMKLQSFTLINLLPQSMLNKEKGQVDADMKDCVIQNKRFQFRQVSWEDFIEMIKGLNKIPDKKFWDYIQRKL